MWNRLVNTICISWLLLFSALIEIQQVCGFSIEVNYGLDSDSGDCDNSSTCNLRAAALKAAQYNETVRIELSSNIRHRVSETVNFNDGNYAIVSDNPNQYASIVSNSTETLFGVGTGSSLSIENLEIFGFSSEESSGGVFNMASEAKLNLTNSKFMSNSAVQGGVIYAATETTILVQGCTFTNNSGTFGGVIYAGEKSELHVYDSIFSENNAAFAYGVLFLDSDITFVMSNSIVTKNTAIYISTIWVSGGSVYISDSEISDNFGQGGYNVYIQSGGSYVSMERVNVKGNYNAYFFGFLYLESGITFVFKDSNFENNISPYGTLLVGVSSNEITFDNCTIINNRATNGNGIIYLDQDSNKILLNQTTFSGNYGYSLGGFYFQGTSNDIVFIDSRFHNNSATTSGAILYSTFADVKVYGCQFSNNTASTSGGDLYLVRVTLEMNDTNFIWSKSTSGGSIYYERSVGSFDNVRAWNGEAKNGGFIHISSSSSAVMSNMRFSDNSAQTYGGAIYCNSYSELTIDNSYFSSNTAQEGSGLYMGVSTQTKLSETEFIDNYAESQGAAVSAMFSKQLNITAGKFHNNNASSNGGALYLFGGELHLENVTVTDNIALKNGGFMHVQNAEYSIKNGIFMHNEAQGNGGCISAKDSSNGELIGCDFKANVAKGNGGAIGSVQSDLKVKDCLFSENYAQYAAGSIYFYYGLYTILGSSFTQNKAQVSGGALYLDNCQDTKSTAHSCSISSSNLTENTAAQSGGAAAMIEGDSPVHLNNVDIMNNSCASFGGGLYAQDATIVSSNMNIISNNGSSGAGAYISCRIAKDILLSHLTLQDNHGDADSSGGGLHISLCNVNISNSVVDGNKAGQASAIYVDAADSFQLVGVTVKNHQELTGAPSTSEIGTVHVLDTGFVNIDDCTFEDNGILDANIYGGALHLSSTPGSLQNTVFQMNKGSYGGAVKIYGPSNSSDCQVSFDQCSFSNNKAYVGGAVYWSGWQPCGLSNSDDFNNRAISYGDFIASEAAQVSSKVQSIKVNSGNLIQKTIEVCLEDNQENVVTTLNGSLVSVSIGEDASVSGSTLLGSTTGCVSFSNLEAAREPETSTNLTFTSLDVDALVNVGIQFRKCQSGEIEFSTGSITTCASCQYGKYSMDPNEDVPACHTCPDGAVCYGGNHTKATLNYWRLPGTRGLCDSDNEFDDCEFFECPIDDVCLGDELLDATFSIAHGEKILYSSEDFTDEFDSGDVLVLDGAEYTVDTISSSSITLTSGYTGQSSSSVEVYLQQDEGCEEGYTGNLCQSCAIGYGLVSEGLCEECPNSLALSILVVVLGLIAVFCLGLIMLKQELDGVGEKTDQLNVLMKIFGSYLQLVGLFSYISLSWPSAITDYFSLVKGLSHSGDSIINVNCVFNRVDTTGLSTVQKSFIFYMFIIPIGLFMSAVFWAGFYYCKIYLWSRNPWHHNASIKKKLTDLFYLEDDIVIAQTPEEIDEVLEICGLKATVNEQKDILEKSLQIDMDHVSEFKGSNLNSSTHRCRGFKLEWLFEEWKNTYFKGACKRNALLTAIVLLFLVYPNVAYYTFLMFTCEELAEGQYFLSADLDYKCYTKEHMIWVVCGSLPGMIFFTFGVPIAAALLLRKIAGDLEDASIRDQYGFLFEGYHQKYYYWECVIMFRKFLIAFIAVYISPYSDYSTGLTGFGVGMAFLILQLEIQPFEDQDHNDCESLGLAAAIFTLLCGLFFYEDSLNYGARMTMAALVAIFNAVFFAYLAYVGYTDIIQKIQDKKEQAQKVSERFQKIVNSNLQKKRLERIVLAKKEESSLKPKMAGGRRSSQIIHSMKNLDSSKHADFGEDRSQESKISERPTGEKNQNIFEPGYLQLHLQKKGVKSALRF